MSKVWPTARTVGECAVRKRAAPMSTWSPSDRALEAAVLA